MAVVLGLLGAVLAVVAAGVDLRQSQGPLTYDDLKNFNERARKVAYLALTSSGFSLLGLILAVVGAI